jgi:hypothetical protein
LSWVRLNPRRASLYRIQLPAALSGFVCVRIVWIITPSAKDTDAGRQ